MADKVKSLIEEAISSNGYILDSVSYEKEGSNYFLRVIIDKENDYVNINDCVKVNEIVNPILDEIKELDEYILDVCSKEKGSI